VPAERAGGVHWGEVQREGSHFTALLQWIETMPPVAAASVEPSEDNVMFQGATPSAAHQGDDGRAPVRLLRHTYELGGPLAAGEYRFSVQLDGVLLGERAFRVSPDPEPPSAQPVIAALEFAADADGKWSATARVVFPRPGFSVLDWGLPVLRDGHFQVALVTGPTPEIQPPVAAAVILPRPVQEHTYELGVLPEGRYSFAISANGAPLGLRFFHVGGPPPPTPPTVRLAYIDILHGDVSTAAEVCCHLGRGAGSRPRILGVCGSPRAAARLARAHPSGFCPRLPAWSFSAGSL